MTVQGFLLYRIFYRDAEGRDVIAYIGRTKQPLQTRIRGHLFAKPMHRTISIEQVTRIEYARLQTEADMNLYEIYYILKEHPPLNVDDKTRDYPTVDLPPVEWKEFTTPLWEKWREELQTRATQKDKLRMRYRQIPEEMRIVRSMRRTGEINEDEYWDRHEALNKELDQISKELWG